MEFLSIEWDKIVSPLKNIYMGGQMRYGVGCGPDLALKLPKGCNPVFAHFLPLEYLFKTKDF
jgi:hypothetical protein